MKLQIHHHTYRLQPWLTSKLFSSFDFCFIFTLLFCSTLHLVLEQGDLATEAIIDYSSILAVIAQVQSLSSEIEAVLQHIIYQSAFFIGNIDLYAFNQSDYLLYISLEQLADAWTLLSTTDSYVRQKSNVLNKTTELSDIMLQLATDVVTHAETSNLVEFEINGTLMDITNDLSEVYETVVATSSTLTIVTNDTSHVLTSINATQSVSMH